LSSRFGAVIRGASDEERHDVEASAFRARIPAGRNVFVEGQAVEAIALLLSGVVRVYQVRASGREITPSYPSGWMLIRHTL